MFDELAKQAGRLFSSKRNAGKQVAKLTDRLHSVKQLVVALSIVLLMGYSKFRDDFKCQPAPGVAEKITSNFCWANGTTTVVGRDQPPTGGLDGTQLPHIGLEHLLDGRNQRTIQHGYMRFYWTLLILIGLCSYLARRRWSALFQDDILQALLRLPGAAENRIAKAAENARPYELLAMLPHDIGEELDRKVKRNPKFAEMSQNERVSHTIAIVDKHANIYDHQLDYYPNQLTYLLLTKEAAAYKLSSLKLRAKLISHCILSTCFTLMQFALPLLIIGDEYTLYGWTYLSALLTYLDSASSLSANSIDYELSPRIFPLSTQCEYKQYGQTGEIESYHLQCTAAINEISSKLFATIWWFVILSLLAEFWSLLELVLCSLNFATVRWTFGWRFWPGARQEANFIATFRHRRSMVLNRGRRNKLLMANKSKGPADIVRVAELSGGERKRLEADSSSIRHRDDYLSDEDYYKNQNICSKLVRPIANLICGASDERHGRPLGAELERDINVFYLLYFIYLRLGSSRTRVEEVIRMTSSVLSSYLEDLGTHLEEETSSGASSEQFEESNSEPSNRATSTIVNGMV